VAAPEPNVRELFVVQCRFEFGHPGFVQRHALFPPVGRFLFYDLDHAAPRPSGFYELDQG
jgi:hypothetical protein